MARIPLTKFAKRTFQKAATLFPKDPSGNSVLDILYHHNRAVKAAEARALPGAEEIAQTMNVEPDVIKEVMMQQEEQKGEQQEFALPAVMSQVRDPDDGMIKSSTLLIKNSAPLQAMHEQMEDVSQDSPVEAAKLADKVIDEMTTTLQQNYGEQPLDDSRQLSDVLQRADRQQTHTQIAVDSMVNTTAAKMIHRGMEEEKDPMLQYAPKGVVQQFAVGGQLLAVKTAVQKHGEQHMEADRKLAELL